MSKDYESEDGVRIIPLSDMRDFEVAEGFPDIRGWQVHSADGAHSGKVHELLVDADSMRTRYLDVKLTSDLAAMPGDRHVLVPIGAARLNETAKVVSLPLNVERIGLLPPYDHTRLTRAHEYEVRRHFSLGEAAAAAATATPTTGAAAKSGFYDDARYDDRRFFSGPVPHSAPVADAHDTRVPIAPDDTVVLKRGQDGHDEVIIRRPTRQDERGAN